MTTPCRSDPIESPYDFAQRVAGLVTSRWTTADHRRVADVIAERDRRVRAEALLGVVRWLDDECGKASSCGRASALSEATEHFRALASGDSDG